MKSIDYYALVQMLLERTDKREVNWQITRDNEFKVILKSGAVTISKDWDSGLEEFVITFRIYNISGDNIYEYASQPKDTFTSISSAGLNYTILESLHVKARSAYYKVEETIENIFKEISNNKEIGSKEKPIPPSSDPNDLPW